MKDMLLIRRTDGGVTFMHLVVGVERGGLAAITDEAIAHEIEKWSAVSGYQAAAWELIERSEVPEDRTFRSALGHDLTVNMVKAREIHRQRLRDIRAPLLAAADIDMLRAMEASNKTEQSRLSALKQQLRDVTADPAIDAATTPEALKAVMPQVLKP